MTIFFKSIACIIIIIIQGHLISANKDTCQGQRKNANDPHTITKVTGGSCIKKKKKNNYNRLSLSNVQVSNSHYYSSKQSNNNKFDMNRHNKVSIIHHTSSQITPRVTSSLLQKTLNRFSLQLLNKISAVTAKIDKQDFAIVASYFLGAISIATPVILLPMIEKDPFSSVAISNTKLLPNEGAAFVATIMSLSVLGSAFGKFINGFVVKSIGPKLSAGLYLLAISAFSMLLSTTDKVHGYAIAGMEFCFTIMWPACNVLFSNRYERDTKKLSNLVTFLSLGSTGGNLLTKILGAMLLRHYHWRDVARMSSVASIIGSVFMFCVVKDVKSGGEKRNILFTKGGSQMNDGFSFHSIYNSLRHILGSPMFWIIGFAHGATMIARQSDKLLAPFVKYAAQVPSYICGSLTSSVTLGFVHGLVSSRKIHGLRSSEAKGMFISSGYRRAAVSALILAICGNKAIYQLLGRNSLIAIISLASGTLASSVAYQFYQFPVTFGKTFGNDKAICMSFIEGVAYLMVSYVWSIIGKIISSDRLGSHGWSLAWLIVAGYFVAGGNVIMRSLSSVI